MNSVRILTVTVSDTRTLADDSAGKALAEELAAFRVVDHLIVKDEPKTITALVTQTKNDDTADAIVFTGGTGIAPRDQTYEALEAMFDKRLDGFGEAFRRLSWDEIGPRAILSRAVAGTVGRLVVFALPGSEKGARLGARALVGPVVAHAVDLVQGRTHHHG